MILCFICLLLDIRKQSFYKLHCLMQFLLNTYSLIKSAIKYVSEIENSLGFCILRNFSLRLSSNIVINVKLIACS